MVDARLPDGSRVNAIIPPLALDGPVLSIRRFGAQITVADLPKLENVDYLSDPHEVMVRIDAQSTAEIEEEAAPVASAAEPEVLEALSTLLMIRQVFSARVSRLTCDTKQLASVQIQKTGTAARVGALRKHFRLPGK